jgi:hypothetical protein
MSFSSPYDPDWQRRRAMLAAQQQSPAAPGRPGPALPLVRGVSGTGTVGMSPVELLAARLATAKGRPAVPDSTWSLQ